MRDIELYEARQTGGLLLNANEASEGFSSEVMDRIHQALDAMAFNRYPDDDCTALHQAYAAWAGLQPSQVLAGNGSDAMLGLMIGLFTSRDKSLVTWDPDFSMYDYYASMQEAEIRKVPVGDIQALSAAGRDAGLVVISNPNNPTGLTLSREQIRQILAALPDTPVVVDEAYMDFSDQSMLDEIEDWDNLYVTRTLSKALGAAGLRLGFLVTSDRNMRNIRPYKVPYGVNAFTQAAGTVLLQMADAAKDRIDRICTERDRLYEALNDINLPVQPSGANFLFLQGEGMEALGQGLEKAGIIVRTWPGKDQIRITIGLPEENDQVLAAIRELTPTERKGTD